MRDSDSEETAMPHWQTDTCGSEVRKDVTCAQKCSFPSPTGAHWHTLQCGVQPGRPRRGGGAGAGSIRMGDPTRGTCSSGRRVNPGNIGVHWVGSTTVSSSRQLYPPEVHSAWFTSNALACQILSTSPCYILDLKFLDSQPTSLASPIPLAYGSTATE